jgi:acetylornithine deacetylase
MGARIRAERPQDPDFDVPYTTLHTGVVRGGTALNIVPKECHFDFEVRHLPADDPDALFAEIKRFAEEELLPPMRAVSADAGFTWTPLSATPGLDMAEEHPATTFVKSLTGQNATTKMAIGTEAGLFQRGGIPTIIIGPGSVDQAHTPDEFVALDQVAQCEEMMRRLADRVCRTAR